MQVSDEHQSSGETATDQQSFEYYIPGMPRLAFEPGRVERFVSKLFRRRGGLQAVIRSKDR